jgi:hypothetical protein
VSGPGVVHWNKYHRLTSDELDELVGIYDDPDAHMVLNNAWQEQGMDHYMDWFYTVWSARGSRRAGKSQLQGLVERAGFIDPE